METVRKMRGQTERDELKDRPGEEVIESCECFKILKKKKPCHNWSTVDKANAKIYFFPLCVKIKSPVLSRY